MGRSLKREEHHHGGKPVGSGLIDDAKGYEECNCCLKCEFAPGKVHVRTTIAKNCDMSALLLTFLVRPVRWLLFALRWASLLWSVQP